MTWEQIKAEQKFASNPEAAALYNGIRDGKLSKSEAEKLGGEIGGKGAVAACAAYGAAAAAPVCHEIGKRVGEALGGVIYDGARNLIDPGAKEREQKKARQALTRGHVAANDEMRAIVSDAFDSSVSKLAAFMRKLSGQKEAVTKPGPGGWVQTKPWPSFVRSQLIALTPPARASLRMPWESSVTDPKSVVVPYYELVKAVPGDPAEYERLVKEALTFDSDRVVDYLERLEDAKAAFLADAGSEVIEQKAKVLAAESSKDKTVRGRKRRTSSNTAAASILVATGIGYAVVKFGGKFMR